MMFIGDFGWFYISARDGLLSGDIPLVGITSSHTWIHQGPFWTYLLVLGFLLFSYHPLVGGYTAILFGLASILGIYKLGKELYSTKLGIIVAVLFATSPLVIIHARMPYHTAPIPFFTICYLYCLKKVSVGNLKFSPLCFLFLSILYNFELATVVLALPLLIVLGLAIYKKVVKVKALRDTRLITTSLLAFMVPLIPVLIYDIQNGFKQTIVFSGWIGYQVIKGIYSLLTFSSSSTTSISDFLSFCVVMLQRLIFLEHVGLAITLFVASIFLLSHKMFRNYKEKKIHSDIVIGAAFFIPLLGFIFMRTPSEAYLPMLFPGVILLLSLLFSSILTVPRIGKIVGVLLIVCVITLNTVGIIKNNYFMGKQEMGYGPTFAQRLEVTRIIQSYAGERPIQLKGEGMGSEFASFTDSYVYLFWWSGGKIEKNADLTITVKEEVTGITIFIDDKRDIRKKEAPKNAEN